VSDPLVIGVDVGGTKILSGVLDREGNVSRRNVVESPGTSEADVLAAVDSAVETLLEDRVAAVGIGIPANLDRTSGRVLRATNLPFDDFDLGAHARSRFGLPVGIENDANAAALAEWKLGAGRGLQNMLLLTLGTGVGGGIVLDDRLYRGWAEIGHMVVLAGGPPCQGNCHGRGHLEALVSGTAADRIAVELWGPDATSHTFVERARGGFEDALAQLDAMAEYLGAAIGSLVNLFDPELVVVGGGFGEAVSDLLLGPAQDAARRQALAPADVRLRVVPAQLGSDAGLVGAALVGFEAFDGAW
jgi:glucokinase